MKKIFIKIIIYLFEKYAFDEWVDRQEKENIEQIKKDNNLNDDEVEEFLIDKNQEGYREAYYAGKEDGYNRALEDYGWY